MASAHQALWLVQEDWGTPVHSMPGPGSAAQKGLPGCADLSMLPSPLCSHLPPAVHQLDASQSRMSGPLRRRCIH